MCVFMTFCLHLFQLDSDKLVTQVGGTSGSKLQVRLIPSQFIVTTDCVQEKTSLFLHTD